MTPVQRLNLLLQKLPTWPVYALGLPIPVYYLYLGLTGELGVDPVKVMEHWLGELALQTLILTMAMTPLRNYTGINFCKFRRAFGLMTFYFVTCHLLVWLILDVQIMSQIWNDILRRPYISVGLAAFILMLPVAATSNNFSVRKLGPKKWKRVQMLTYVCILLGAIHYVMLTRGFQWEPMIYFGLTIFLLALRLPWTFRRAPKTQPSASS